MPAPRLTRKQLAAGMAFAETMVAAQAAALVNAGLEWADVFGFTSIESFWADAASRYEDIDEGSTRRVFGVPGAPLVLKLPWSLEGRESNIAEVVRWRCAGRSSRRHMARVYAGDANYVLMERLVPRPYDLPYKSMWKLEADPLFRGVRDLGARGNWGRRASGEHVLLDYGDVPWKLGFGEAGIAAFGDRCS